MHRYQRRPWKWVLAATAVTGLVAAGCGGDDGDEVSDRSPSQESASADADAAGGELASYCDAELAIETAPEPEIDFETATPEQQADAVRTYAGETMRPLADDVLATAPAELDGDLAVLDEAVDQLAETGDFGVWEQPEVATASDAVHAFDLESCGWSRVDVTATEYAFGGIPEELDAGVVSFELASQGSEVHELVLARKNDGVTETAEELLALPEEEAMAKVTPLETNAFTAPGESDYLVVDLEPGDYMAVCFVPTGMTSEDEPPAGEPGPPHAMQGMYTELRVR